jgi:DNA recombination protein RmuC
MAIFAIILLILLLAAAVVWIVRLTGRAASLQAQLQSAQTEASRLRTDDERFRTIATGVLADSQRTMRRDSSAQMQELLKPLREGLDAFSRTIDEKYSREAAERFALREKIDELRALNDALGHEARQLSQALRGDSKVQGDWGEMILQTLLEKAGFVEGREFTVQQTRDEQGRVITNEHGARLRPDVVVNFPGKSCVVIDSKASLTAYVNYINADTPEAQQVAGRAHVASVRRHVDELSRKRYQDYIGDRRLDFVMMFIPNEGAYIAAMQLEPDLWQEAYDLQVLIISPTHLFSVLRLVEQMWRHDAQTRNAVEIAVEAGKMYDKFAGFVADMQNVEKNLGRATDAYGEAMRKLSSGTGNLLTRAQRLRELGAKTSKELGIKGE